MAKAQKGSQKPALTRGKAALIGFLAIVLVIVVYAQYGRYAGGADKEPQETAVKRAPVRKPASPQEIKPAETNVDAEDDTQAALLEFDQTKWKSPELSKVIAYDPFALPAGFPRLAASHAGGSTDDSEATADEKSKQLADALAELRMQLDELKERGVHVIIGQKNQYVALIGDRKIHVGDEINGFTVTEIDPKHGVRVEMKRSE